MKSLIRVIIFVLTLAFLLSICVGCGETLKDFNLEGQNPLHKVGDVLKETTEIPISGLFFLGCGSVSGGTKVTVDKLLFYWGKDEKEYIPLVLPASVFRYEADESKETPTVEFKVNNFCNFNQYVVGGVLDYAGFFKNYLEAGNPLVVIIRMKKVDLENEKYIPKARW